MHMLVVEDDPMVRGMLVKLLSLSGQTVREARGGAEALALIQAERFDAVLLDHLMPEMTGIEVLEKLRAMGVESPVGFITGSRGHPDIEALARRSVPVLFKPFSVTDLRTFLDRVTASRERVSR
jgi:CheY-like chemotaxis protein